MNYLFFLGASLFWASCGLHGGSPNQGNCTGTYLAGGGLSAVSGSQGTPSSISGTVTSYDQGGGNYCINLAGISYTGPCTGALMVEAQVGSTYILAGSITIFSGTQNFYFTAGSAPAWVYWHCQTEQPAPSGMYARAQLL